MADIVETQQKNTDRSASAISNQAGCAMPSQIILLIQILLDYVGRDKGIQIKMSIPHL